jgi:hypothetical protein
MAKGKKMRKIERMLRRKKGATSRELREALHWPSISIPQRARQLGIKTRRETRYWAV